MKQKIVALLLLGILHLQSIAQSKTPLSTDYIGLGTGIHATTGIMGVTYEHIFKEHIGAFMNAGVGGWGYKLGVGGRMYFKNALGGAVGLNVTHVLGQKGVKADMPVIDSTNKEVTQKIEYDAHPVTTINISYLKFWKMGAKGRFNIELGYSIPLNGKSADNYTIKTPNVKLTEASSNALLFIQPGGIMIAVGFTFGI